jgi:hypothetical protein
MDVQEPLNSSADECNSDVVSSEQSPILTKHCEVNEIATLDPMDTSDLAESSTTVSVNVQEKTIDSVRYFVKI